MQFLTMDDVAGRLHVSKRWLQGYVSGKPLGRIVGKKRLFTEADVMMIWENMPCPSSSTPARTARQTTAYAASSMELELTKARELLISTRLEKLSKNLKFKSNVEPFVRRRGL